MEKFLSLIWISFICTSIYSIYNGCFKLSINFRFFFFSCLILTHGLFGLEDLYEISSSFIPWGLCMDLYCFCAVHFPHIWHLGSWGLCMDFIFFQSLKTMCGLVLFQAVPVHKNLGSWEQCMRSNLIILLFLGNYVWYNCS